jgi:hypothetical protein
MSNQGQDELHDKGVGGPGRPAPRTPRGIVLCGGTLLLSCALLASCSPWYVEKKAQPENVSGIETVAEGGVTVVYTLCNHGNRLYVYKAGYAGGIAVVPQSGDCGK